MDLLQTAKKMIGYGQCVLAVRREKYPPITPDGKWKQFKDRLPEAWEIEWMCSREKTQGLCLLGGEISGQLFIRDFEAKDRDGKPMPCVYDQWEKRARVMLAEAGAAPDFYDRFVVDSTRSNGIHLFYKVSTDVKLPSTKLAKDGPGKDASTLIESKAEGGYVLIPPSPGYETIQGDFASIPVVSEELHRAFLEIDASFDARQARSRNESKAKDSKSQGTAKQPDQSGQRPGDAYNESDAFKSVLEASGWRCLNPGADHEYWVRPGKDRGHSATFNAPECPGKFYVFSDNAQPFEENTSYSPFAVCAMLRHDGDFVQAARELGRQGFGDKAYSSQSKTSQDESSQSKTNQDDLRCSMDDVWLQITDLDPEDRPELLTHRTQELLWSTVLDAASWSEKDLGVFIDRLHNILGLTLTWVEGWRRAVNEERSNEKQEKKEAAFEEKKKDMESDDEWIPYSDAYNGGKFIEMFGENYIWVDSWNFWMVWDGKRWKPDTLLEVERDMERTIRGLIPQINEMRRDSASELLKHIAQSLRQNRIRWAIENVKHKLSREASEFDNQSHLFNVSNGTIDTRTGELLPHRREDLLTKFSDVEYRGLGYQHQTWEEFLSACQPEQETRDYLSRACGYTMTNDVDADCLFYCYGEGSNGKSSLIGAVREALGDYAAPAPRGMLQQKRYAADSTKSDFEVASLAGLRMAIGSEIPKGHKMAEDLVKDLTGGDTIKGRHPYGRQYFEVKPTYKFWLYGNHLLEIRGTDDGVWRRIRLIKFDQQFKSPDRTLRDRLKNTPEIQSAILAWMVRGAMHWHEHHDLDEPDGIINDTQAYRDSMDEVGNFINEFCEVDDDLYVSCGVLFDTYKESFDGKLSRRHFSEELTKRGFEVKRQRWGGKSVRCRVGIKLLNGEDLSTDGNSFDGDSYQDLFGDEESPSKRVHKENKTGTHSESSDSTGSEATVSAVSLSFGKKSKNANAGNFPENEGHKGHTPNGNPDGVRIRGVSLSPEGEGHSKTDTSDPKDERLELCELLDTLKTRYGLDAVFDFEAQAMGILAEYFKKEPPVGVMIHAAKCFRDNQNPGSGLRYLRKVVKERKKNGHKKE